MMRSLTDTLGKNIQASGNSMGRISEAGGCFNNLRNRRTSEWLE
jgi:hypothetical protein